MEALIELKENLAFITICEMIEEELLGNPDDLNIEEGEETCLDS